MDVGVCISLFFTLFVQHNCIFINMEKEKKKSYVIGIRVSNAFKEEIEGKASSQDRTLSNYIKKLIKDDLKKSSK